MDILLLEDDRILCESLEEYLELAGYRVDAVTRGEAVYDLTFEKTYDLYILDVNVPDISGFDVLRALREAGDETPAFFITALVDINSITEGFAVGAEDYIKKPFDPQELLLRIQSKYGTQEHWIIHENLAYDPEARVLKQEGRVMGLGEVQSRLFHELITHVGEVVESYTLMDHLEFANANALRVNIAKLKKRLGLTIVNIRGRGYMLEKIRD
jgi:DNA-binding response OmpR family regulator